VAKAVNNETGKKVAIKRIDKIFEDQMDSKRILREITLLRKLRHPCVVELVEIINPKNPNTFDTIYVVMEYV